ncbi:hypothetical protein RJT34_21808 [Clitoria ternatea]|uniref:Uncharacterized protein n=1 Tax=Clitoria ternatea TaxID=43366 RepID=A0AAN9P6N1_CLITE
MAAVRESGNALCHIAPTADLQDVALKHVQTLIHYHQGWFQPVLRPQRPTTLPPPLPGLDSSPSPPPECISTPKIIHHTQISLLFFLFLFPGEHHKQPDFRGGEGELVNDFTDEHFCFCSLSFWVGLNLEDMELSSEEWEEAKTKPKGDEEKDPCFGFLSLCSLFLTESGGGEEEEELECGLSLDGEGLLCI